MADPYSNNRRVLQLLTSLKVPMAPAQGALASLMGESGPTLNGRAFNPNDPGGSYGWGQWNQSRYDALKDIAKQYGGDITSPDANLQMIQSELQGGYGGVLDKLRAAKSPEEGAAIWTKDYEAPKVDNTAQRLARFGPIAQSVGLTLNGNSTPSVTQADLPVGAGLINPIVPGAAGSDSNSMSGANLATPTLPGGVNTTGVGPSPAINTSGAMNGNSSGEVTNPSIAQMIGNGDWKGALGGITGNDKIMGALGGLAKMADGGAKPAPAPAVAPLETNSSAIAAAAPNLMAQLMAKKKMQQGGYGMSLGGIGGMGM